MHRTKLLLIDDEPLLAETLKEILKFNGYEVEIAMDGLQALEISKEYEPDLIICDILMPNMDGFTFYNHYRGINGNTPFIFLSAKSEYSDIRAGMLHGADDYLIKPVKANELINSINARLLRKTLILAPELKRIEKLEQAIGLITMHEFKNPLTAIKGFLDLIRIEIEKLEKPRLIEYLSYIEYGANRIMDLLLKVTTWNDIQQYGNQMRQGVFVKSDLSNIVTQNAQEIAKKYHRTNDLTLSINAKPLINFSPELIIACFSELIDNAFKFSTKGDCVRITISSVENKFIVTVEDYGNHSSAEELMEYEPFTQFGRKFFEQQGLGIGISISKSIAALLKTKVEFIDNKPWGIIAKICIPENL